MPLRDEADWSKEGLRRKACYIRDVLDVDVARDGPDALHANEVLLAHDFFSELGQLPMTLETLRFSRIHRAIMQVAGQGTRWPGKLVDRCDAILENWTAMFGPLHKIKPLLYEPGGRLYGICKLEDHTRADLMARWQADGSIMRNHLAALKHGHIGFTPGQWWINEMFAFHAGIIDFSNSNGGICADETGAYAIVMTDSDEIDSHENQCTYRTHATDKGRYRLSSAEADSRQPIRVLRSHRLRSLHAPRAGLRYDGLHNVVGWSVTTVNGRITFDIHLRRIPEQISFDAVKCHPTAEEVEDYKEYKRIRSDWREQRMPVDEPLANQPLESYGADGSYEGRRLSLSTASSPFAGLPMGRADESTISTLETLVEEQRLRMDSLAFGREGVVQDESPLKEEESPPNEDGSPPKEESPTSEPASATSADNAGPLSPTSGKPRPPMQDVSNQSGTSSPSSAPSWAEVLESVQRQYRGIEFQRKTEEEKQRRLKAEKDWHLTHPW